ncbi:MAG: BamA/TamA family outer membrane protein [Candidatus Neomarinimicrobiota bacterium]|nr:BamA/TamA family outer membrane protein [Candidatus Neomarinimicrobiota bacterium]
MKFIIIILTTNIVFGFSSSLSDSSKFTTNEIRFYSDITIDSSEIITNNIRILGGGLTVYGTVESQITVIGGDVHILSSAIINGKIVAIGGDVQTDKDAQINGKIVEASLNQGLIYRETFTDSSVLGEKDFEISTFSQHQSDGWVHPKPTIFQYNRNEGLRFVPLNWNWDHRNESMIRLSFSLGYRFSSSEFIGRTTLESSLLKNRSATIFASGFKTVRTDDEFRLPEKENSWAGFFGRQDFYDRWDETGFEAGFGLDFSYLKVKGKFIRATQSEIPVDQDLWSLTNEGNVFRNNLFKDSTNIEIDYLEGVAAFRTASYSPLKTGFAILSEMDMTLRKNDSILADPSLRLIHIAMANWEVAKGVVLRNRLILGMGSESLPIYRQFGIGGMGSVSAHGYKSQLGNHMAQINTELVFTEQFTDSWFMVKLFYDGGMAYNSNDLVDIGYISEHSDLLLQSAGIGFGWEDGDKLKMGFNFAKQLGSNSPIESTVRLNFNF